MAIQYTWDISKLDTYPVKEGFQNVVFNIHWNLTAVDGEYTASQNGISTVSLKEDSEFVDYEDLTKEKIVEWVEDDLSSIPSNLSHRGMPEEVLEEDLPTNLELLKMDLATRIRDLKNPPVASPPLPW